MNKSYTLSEKDHNRVQEQLRWTERNKNLRNRHRRRNLPSAGSNITYARIVQTLCRADPSAIPPITAINWYEIEFLNDPIQLWSDTYGTYYVGDLVKYTAGSETKIYECRQEHTAHSSLPPTVTSHWAESSNTKAWVFGYSGDLLDSAPWFQTGDIVRVIRYVDSRWPDRLWWILETAVKIAAGTGLDRKESLHWIQGNSDGDVEARLASVYR